MTTFIIVGLYFATLYITMFTLFGNYVLWENTVEERYTKDTYKMQSLAGLIVFVYIVLVFSAVFYSLHVKANQKPFIFRLICHSLGLYMLGSFGALVWMTYNTIYLEKEDYFSAQDQVKMLLEINVVSYGLTILVNPSCIPKIMRSCLAYIYYMPSYMHTFLIYAFCRIDDFSWGTKGSDSSDESKKANEFKHFKIDFMSAWIFINALIAFIIIYLNTISVTQNYFFVGLGKILNNFLIKITLLLILEVSMDAKIY